MKKVLFLAVAVTMLCTASASAKDVTVDISKLGFVPAAVTVQAGDVVTFTNKDTANHQVVCAKCPFTSAVLKPGEGVAYTYLKPGKFTSVDPLNKNEKVTITVKQAPAAVVNMSAKPTTVLYGHSAVVAGTLSPAQVGQKLEILAQPCGTNNAKSVSTVVTTAGGAFTYQAQPAVGTSYHARYRSTGGVVTSSAVNLAVRPTVTLVRLAPNKFGVNVVANQSFVGKVVAFQRYVVTKRRWSTVRAVTLGTRATQATPIAGTTVSSKTFRAKLVRGLRVRAVLPPAQAAPCYLAASSKTIRS